MVAVPLMLKYIPNFEPFDKESKLDIFGIIVLALMNVVLIISITEAAEHASFNNTSTILWMCSGFSLVMIYLVHDRISKKQTVLPINLFRRKTFLAASSGLFLANIAIMGPMLILPLFFINIHDMTPIQASLALIPQGIGMLITRPLIGKMIDRIGAKFVVIVSLLISLIGSVPFIFITEETSIMWISVILFIRGSGVGGIMLPLMSDAYKGLEDKQLPQAGVGVNMIENIGSSFGTAIIATVVATVMQGLETTITNELRAYQAGFLISVVVLLVIFIPSLFLTHKNSS